MNLFEQKENDTQCPIMKIGEVSSVDPSNCTARVAFDDDDGLVSGNLQVVQINTFKNKGYWLPDVGEDVICLFFGTGIEDGVILGAVYAGNVMPAHNSKDIRGVKFSDGSIFQFDRLSRTFYIEIGSTKVTMTTSSVTVETSDSVNVKAQEVNVEGGAAVNVKGGMAVNVQGGTAVNVNGGATIALGAPSITFTSGNTTMQYSAGSSTWKSENLILQGNMTVTGDFGIKGSMDIKGNMDVDGYINATGKIHGA